VPRYALITPARNEAANLERLAPCVVAQTVTPEAWVIVDDGSDDGTATLAAELAARHPWIHVMPAPGADGSLVDGRRQGRDVIAFHAGLASLGATPEFVVKLDADVSFADDYFELLLSEFAADPTLGIASGTCYEHDGEGWKPWLVTEGHVRGATRVWSRACLEAVLPLEERLGWDGVDELKAATLGWTTRSVAGLPFFHHRAFAAREGARWRAWATTGRAAHYLGSRPSYVVLRSLHHARREPAALALAWGYGAAALRGEPRCPDPDVRGELRRRQRARHLARRVRDVA
jgi:glycosyltransferase involved in cell wall biosynthesis